MMDSLKKKIVKLGKPINLLFICNQIKFGLKI